MTDFQIPEGMLERMLGVIRKHTDWHSAPDRKLRPFAIDLIKEAWKPGPLPVPDQYKDGRMLDFFAIRSKVWHKYRWDAKSRHWHAVDGVSAWTDEEMAKYYIGWHPGLSTEAGHE